MLRGILSSPRDIESFHGEATLFILCQLQLPHRIHFQHAATRIVAKAWTTKDHPFPCLPGVWLLFPTHPNEAQPEMTSQNSSDFSFNLPLSSCISLRYYTQKARQCCVTSENRNQQNIAVCESTFWHTASLKLFFQFRFFCFVDWCGRSSSRQREGKSLILPLPR